MIRKILFSESSRNLGGQELQLIQQMQALAARDIAVKLACRPGSGIERLAGERGLDVEPVAFRNSLHLPSLDRIRRLVRDWRPDAVVSHSGNDADVCGLAARLVRGRPRLVRVKTYQARVPRALTHNWLADRTLVPSAEMRAQVLRNPRIRPERIHVLYPGVAFADIESAACTPLPEAIERWLAAHPGPVLAHVAMLRGEKGHRFMLEVVARLRPRHPDLRYVIAGEGAERAAIAARAAELGLGEHVLLAGLVHPAAALLRRATLAVMPSLVEPLGMAQIEALGLAVPVVASRTGGIPETMADRETGLLVAPGDAAAWCEAIGWALGHPHEMQAMARAGREAVRRKFSVEANTDSFLDLIARE